MKQEILLKYLTGAKAGCIYSFDASEITEITIGRDPSSTLPVDPERDIAVSRHHAVIRWERGKLPVYTLTDLNSVNGTRVNGRRIQSTELRAGDRIDLGSHISLAFDLDPEPRNALMRTVPENLSRPNQGSAKAAAPAALRHRIYRSGAVELDEGLRELRIAGQRRVIEPKPFMLLNILLSRANEAVSKDELMAALWPGITVDEGSLTTAMHGLRRALGQERGMIRAVVRFGYQVTEPVEMLPSDTNIRPARP